MNKNLFRHIRLDLKYVKLFFILFYIVGIAGIIYPKTNHFFINLIPLALILGIIALILFHEAKLNLRLILPFIIIFFLGFVIEAIGTNTGMVFGEYRYGGGLGFRLFNTPVCIGLNWLMLVYASSSIFNSLKIAPALKIVLGSFLMVAYDIPLEQAAPAMDMWTWHYGSIPFQNYFSWLILGLAFHSIICLFGTGTKNKIAPFLFGIQMIFFFTLAVYFNLVS